MPQSEQKKELNNPSIIKAWCMYDWANSVYNLVISSAIFPIYYTAVTTKKDANGTIISDTVNLFGIQQCYKRGVRRRKRFAGS